MQAIIPASKLRRALTDWASPVSASDVESVEWRLIDSRLEIIGTATDGFRNSRTNADKMALEWRSSAGASELKESAAVRFTGTGPAQSVSKARKALAGASGSVRIFSDGDTLFVNGRPVNPERSQFSGRVFYQKPEVESGLLARCRRANKPVAEISVKDVVRAASLSVYSDYYEPRPSLSCAWLKDKLADCYEDTDEKLKRGGILATNGFALSIARPYNWNVRDGGEPVYVPLTVLKRMGSVAKRRTGTKSGEKKRLEIRCRPGVGHLAEIDGVIWAWEYSGELEEPAWSDLNVTDHAERPRFWCDASDLRWVADEVYEAHPDKKHKGGPGLRFVFGESLESARVYTVEGVEDDKPLAERTLAGQAVGFFAERPVRVMLGWKLLTDALSSVNATGQICLLPHGVEGDEPAWGKTLDDTVLIRVGTSGAALIKEMWGKWA